MSRKQVWEKFGKDNPYYGVYTAEKFRSENLAEKDLDEFFDSGISYIKEVWDEIETHFIKDFHPKNGLDFGCGVGRLTLPLASKCDSVMGVDLSTNMLKEAEKNAVSNDISNVRFEQADQFPDDIKETFDFIHSFIVFQHINPKQGIKIFESMVKMLETDGIGVLQVSFFRNLKRKNRFTNALYRNFQFVHRVRNFILRKKDDPFIPMYAYDLNKIFKILQDNDCHRTYTRATYHGFEGLIIYFQKREALIT